MPFESFSRLFKGSEGKQESDEPSRNETEVILAKDGELSEKEFTKLLHRLYHEPTTEEERQAINRRLDEHHKKQDERIERELAESRLREAPDMLRRTALEKLPIAEHELDRALNESTKDAYAKEFLTVDKSELPFQHFLDLENSVRFVEEWKRYLPKEHYEVNIQKVRGRAEKVKGIMDDYRSWASAHEDPRDTKRVLFELLANLQRIDPDNFSRDLIDLSDEEFSEIGSGGMTLRDGRNHVRKLLSRANLAEFDAERFRRIFGAEYSKERMDEARKYWEEWDRQYPTEMPKCAPAWEKIERSLQEMQAA